MSTITNIKQAEQQLENNAGGNIEDSIENNNIEIEMVKQELTPKSSQESTEEESKSTTSGSGEDDTGDDSDMV